MIKRTYILLHLILFVIAAFAAPATPYPIEVTLADGTTTQVYLRGDEYAHYYETLDGIPMQLRNGMLVEDLSLPQRTHDKRRAARVAQESLSTTAYPNTGSPRSLVILVNYADVKFTVKNANEAFTNLLNQSGYNEHGAIGSVRDYFIASSDSIFQPQFDVYGPYDLPHDMQYYGGNDDANAPEMILHACSAAEAAGVDFSLYDTDDNGTIDNVFVYYAGNNEAEGASANTVWPHRSAIMGNYRYGDKLLRDYACTSEYRGTGRLMCGIGTFCHEFSHVLGLADLYDTEYTKNTVGTWDLMASGNYNGNGTTPPSYTAFERFSLGWIQPKVLKEAGRYLLHPLLTENQAYLIAPEGKTIFPSTNGEYFLLENRQHVGWDATPSAIPGEGMLIWHIDYKSALWDWNEPNSGKNLCCFIESATGNTLTTGSHADPFPGTRNKTMFNPVWVDGTIANKPILDIQEVGTDISFVFIKEGDKHLLFEPATTVYLNSTFLKKNSSVKREMSAAKLQLIGSSVDPNRAVEITTSASEFQLSVDSVSWKKTIELLPNQDSLLNTSLFVRYRPDRQECDYVSANIIAQQGSVITMLELQGKAPRPTLITQPKQVVPIELTPYSTFIQWDAVEDATNYYLTVYQITDGTTLYKQSFEDFDSPSAVSVAGWQTSFNRLSSLLKEDGNYSLHFVNTDETVVSETYVQPITELSFWYSVPNSDVDTIGKLQVEAYNGDTWIALATIDVTKRDRKKTFEQSFSLEDSYIQFRLTFIAHDGGNGVCVDAFTARCDKQINYLYQGEEKTIFPEEGATTVQAYLSGLTPDNEYFYKLQVSDRYQSGCEEHIVSMENVQSFRTLSGKNGENDLTYALDTLSYSPMDRVIYVPEANGDSYLYFYDLLGHLVASVPVAPMQNIVSLPAGNFIRGHVYIAKYSYVDKLKRKDRWVKFLY